MCTAFLSAEEFVPNFLSANLWGGVEETEDGTAHISPQEAEGFCDHAHVEGGSESTCTLCGAGKYALFTGASGCTDCGAGGTPEPSESKGKLLHALVAVSVQNRSLARTITGMLVKTMDELELVKLIDDNNALQAKIDQMRASLESIKLRELAASGSFDTCVCVCVCVCMCVMLTISPLRVCVMRFRPFCTNCS